MDAERTETRVDRRLLDAVRERAAAEGRDELEVVEEALTAGCVKVDPRAYYPA